MIVKQRLWNETGLFLVTVSAVSSEDTKTKDLYLILFIVSCVFLLLFVALIVFLAVRGSDLNRKVKALSSTNFGSQDSDLNKNGKALPLPNTNKHTIQGSNPVWTVEGHEEDENNQFDNVR